MQVKYFDFLTDNLIGFFAAVFSLIGFWVLSNKIQNSFFPKVKAPRVFFFVLGFGAFYFFFVLSAAILPAKWVIYTACLVLAILIVRNRKSIYQDFTVAYHKLLLPSGLAILMTFPVLARVLGPPRQDELRYYIPSIMWIFEHGLDFNPFMSRYFVMPQGSDYFFTIPYALGGIQGIRLFDTIIGFLLMISVYHLARHFLKKPYAFLAMALIVFFPGTWNYLLGQGKPDILGLLFFSGGLYFALKKQWPLSLISFGATFALKYTYWGFSSIAIVIIGIFYLRAFIKPKHLVLFIIPFLFAAPLEIKNQLQIGNPLASVMVSGNEKRYIRNHGITHDVLVKIKTNADLGYERPWEEKIWQKIIDGNFRAIRTSKAIMYSIWLFTFLGAIFLFRLLPIKQYALLFIILTSIFAAWVFRMGVLWDNHTRFFWAFAIFFALLSMLILQTLQQKFIPKAFASNQNIVLLGLAVLFGILTFRSHGGNLKALYSATKIPLHEWYYDNDRASDAFTLQANAIIEQNNDSLPVIGFVRESFLYIPIKNWWQWETDSLRDHKNFGNYYVPKDFNGYYMTNSQYRAEHNEWKEGQCDTLLNAHNMSLIRIRPE